MKSLLYVLTNCYIIYVKFPKKGRGHTRPCFPSFPSAMEQDDDGAAANFTVRRHSGDDWERGRLIGQRNVPQPGVDVVDGRAEKLHRSRNVHVLSLSPSHPPGIASPAHGRHSTLPTLPHSYLLTITPHPGHDGHPHRYATRHHVHTHTRNTLTTIRMR